jgi:lipopolysaccharide heptosyltransferase II
MKILIVKPSSLGDIVQSGPTLAALRATYPEAAITWLVFDSFADIMPLFPGLGGVMVWHRKGGLKEYWRVLSAIRRERFDLVIDLQGLARTALLTFLSGARRKIGVPGMKELSWLLVKEVFPESRSLNAAERTLETVRFLSGKKHDCAFGVRVPPKVAADARELLAFFSVADRDRVVALVPSARGHHKIWPVEHYRELIGLLIEAVPDIKIIILGTTADVRLIRHPGAIDLSGRTDLVQLAGVAARCNLVIGGDTGPVHLAAALGVPTIALFGGSDVRETAPVAPGARVLKKEFPCSPCRGRKKCADVRCLSAITALEVFDVVRELLKV